MQPIDRALVVEQHMHLAVLRLVRRAEPIRVENSEPSQGRRRDTESIGDLAAQVQLTAERANVSDKRRDRQDRD